MVITQRLLIKNHLSANPKVAGNINQVGGGTYGKMDALKVKMGRTLGLTIRKLTWSSSLWGLG